MAYFVRLVCVAAVLVTAFSACQAAARAKHKFQSNRPAVVFEAKWLNFTFRSVAEYDLYRNGQGHRNTMLAGVKVASNGVYYVSAPRWRPGVPATLSRILSTVHGMLLDPYPSWEMNEEGDPHALQSVLGFEIDSCDRMWILDQGKVNGRAAVEGSIKLVVWDLSKNAEVKRLVFSPSLASPSNSFLNDIVVDQYRGAAYITDSGLSTDPATSGQWGGLLVYDFATNSAHRALDQDASARANTSLWLRINGAPVLQSEPMRTGADGVALAPDGLTLYYCPLTSYRVYKVDTRLLRDRAISDESISESVEDLGDRGFASDGLACDSEGRLYLTSLQHNGILRGPADITSFAATPPQLLIADAESMVWPDTLGWDRSGNLVFVSNRLHEFVQEQLDLDRVNFRIWKLHVGAESYLAGQPGNVCKSDGSRNLVWAILGLPFAVLLVLLATGAVLRGRARARRTRGAAGREREDGIAFERMTE